MFTTPSNLIQPEDNRVSFADKMAQYQATIANATKFIPTPSTADASIAAMVNNSDTRMANFQSRKAQTLMENNNVQFGTGSKVRGTSLGLSAYGWRGRTGNPAMKSSNPYGLNTQMWGALQAANAAMQAAGLGAFGITDGFRSYNAQVDVKKRKGNLAATPGRSVHGIGLAADLDLSGRQRAWLEANGARYGISRIPSESWHYQLLPGVFNGRYE
jgi:hypothetical protein